MSLRAHLQDLYDTHGELTPAIVLEAARPKNHPLHGYVFDRAPKQAAEAYYLGRAHDLLQRARVVYREAARMARHARCERSRPCGSSMATCMSRPRK